MVSLAWSWQDTRQSLVRARWSSTLGQLSPNILPSATLGRMLPPPRQICPLELGFGAGE